jgi:hypothetical protein
MSARMDRILTRLYLTVVGVLSVGFAFYLGAVVGVRRWPYEVQKTVIITPNVPPGATFYMARQIDYQDDCQISYDRLMLSDVPGPKGAIRREVLPDINFEHPPWELDTKLWYISEKVPDDFPCGPARIVDRPSAACNWFQRIFWRQRRADAITPFAVDCSGTSPQP